MHNPTDRMLAHPSEVWTDLLAMYTETSWNQQVDVDGGYAGEGN